MGLQRVRYDLETEQQQQHDILKKSMNIFSKIYIELSMKDLKYAKQFKK